MISLVNYLALKRIFNLAVLFKWWPLIMFVIVLPSFLSCCNLVNNFKSSAWSFPFTICYCKTFHYWFLSFIFLFFLCKNWFTSLLHFSLPYTTAAIYEVQRVADLVPFAVPHETTEAASVSGYHIPKGQENEVLNFWWYRNFKKCTVKFTFQH